MEEKATKTAYLPEFGRTFEVPADWDGTKINYFARQKMKGLSVEETIGMQPLAPKTKYLNYSPLVSNENVLYDLNLKKQGEETGFWTTTGKSAWNELVDLTLGVASEGANVIAQNATERHLNKTQANEERRKEVTKRLLDVQKQSKEWVDEYKFDINPYESKLAQGLGSIGVTYASLGAGILAKTLKGKTVAEAVREGMPLLTLFGLSSGGNMFYDVRQEGGSLLEANTRALSAGLLEAGLERLGLEGIVRGLRSKYVGSYILAPVLTGSAQETAQSAKDTLIKGKYDKRSEEEKLNELIDSALLGAIGGAIEFGVARVVANKGIKKVEQTLEKGGVDKKTARNVAYTQMLPKEEAIKVRDEIRLQGVKAGYDEETSQNIAEAVTQSPEQVLNDVIDLMNREEPYEISEELREELKNTYIEATSVANEDADKYILMKDEIKSLIEKAGKDEQEADETARMMTSIAINSYQIAKEQGVDIDFDKIKNEVFKLNNIINYAQNEPISEAEQEDIWREVERERVAELQEGIDKYMEESQGGVLYSKTEEEDFAKIDRERLEFERKDINAELKGREDEEVKAVVINRFFADKKSSKDISIDDVITRIDEIVEKNEKGVRVLKNSITGETATLSNVAISKMFNSTRSRKDGNIGGILGKESIVNIKDIFNSALLIKTHNDSKHGTKNNIRRYANVIESDGESFIVKLTIKEMSNNRKELTDMEIEENKGRDLSAYDLKVGRKNTVVDALDNLVKDKSQTSNGNGFIINDLIDFVNTYTDKTVKINGVNRTTQNSAGNRIARTEEGLRLFYKWFGDSKVVDKDGIPLVVYHGTQKVKYGIEQPAFDTFLRNKLGRNSYFHSMVGFFFTPSENMARNFGERVMPVYLRLNNPKIYKSGVPSSKDLTLEQEAVDKTDGDNKYFAQRILNNSRKYTDSYDQFVMDIYHKNGVIPYRDSISYSFKDAIPVQNHEQFVSNYIQALKEEGYDGIIIENTNTDASKNNNKQNTQYIVFEPEQIKSVYNRGSFDENNKNIYYSKTKGDILGSYDMAKREVELFKGHNPSTLTHELGHHFIISHLNFMESIGANDKNKPVFEFLSGLANREINSVRDMERADHENLIEAFIDYMNIGQAPNIVTGNIFQRAKNWLINEYNIHKTKASKEIREYFDSLISREGAIPDVSKIQDRIGEFKEILRQAQKGEQVSFNGMGIKEVKDLKKAINTKIRRKGLSLRDELIKAGGIKEGTELAKSLGFDVLKKDKMFTTKEHAIQTEDELIDWLAEKGYITPVQEGESYSDTEARWSEVENLIYDAERVYRPEEQRLNEEREASLVNQAKAQEIVDDILKDNKLGLKGVNDLYDLLQKISSRKDDVDIIKINKGAIKYLETRLNDLQRDYNDIIKQKDIEARKIGKELIKANEEIRNLKEEKEVSKIEKNVAQEQYLEFVRNQHLSGDNKVKFLSNVDEINSFGDLVRVVRQATPQIQRIIEMEMKHLQKRNIDIVLKRSKPKKRTQQISTYTYNKFFEELRAINKMTKEEAKAGISNLMKEMEKRDENMEGFAFEWKDIIKNKFLHYKSLGMDASLDLMTSLHNDLIELYGEAVQKGIDAKIEKSDKRLAEINKVTDYVENNQVARNFISNLFNPKGKSDDVYIKNTNFYGISNALFGKKWADEHEMVTVLNQVQNDVYKRHDQMIKKAKEIYKVSKRDTLEDVIAEKKIENFILTANDGLSYELSIMDIMDLYLGLKNEKTKRQLLKNYEEFDEEGEQITSQIDDLIGNLSVEDKEFADWLQKDLEKNYDELNKLYIKMYGIDMKQEENYFPRKSERRDVILDLENINSYSPIQAISGMMKDRALSVKPLAVNVLQKYDENIAEYYYMIDAFEKFKDIYDVVTSKDVRVSVNKKYSKATYTELIKSLKAMSLRGMQINTSDIDGGLNKIVSNVIGSKIAVNVDVFIKQLISITNYSEKMPVGEFARNFIEAITHPKETIEFMNNFDKEFFEARKNMGLQSEAVSRMKRELENMKHNNFFEEKFNIKGLKISAGFKYQWSQAMGFMVKYGDIGAIYFGGYARVKNLLDSGMSVEEARKQFRFETLQSQQDSSPASLAQYQFAKNGFARMFTAFLNAPAQYMRNIFNADIQYRRKEITAEQFRKTIINYGVIQPALYVLVGNMLRDLWDGDDENSWFDGMASQILTSPLQGIPFLGNMVTQVASYIEKEIVTDKGNTYNLVSVLLADDLNRAFNKIGKEDKGVLDWVDILTPLFETVAVTPVTMVRKLVKAVETRID